MIEKFDEIVSGWKNYMFKSEEVESIAKKRLITCLNCEHITKNKRCSKCGCFIPAKVRSLKSKCPKGFWKK
jgi:hypothetical protein